MKTFATILVVIFTVVLGRWIIDLKGFTFEFLMSIYSAAFIGVFSYGVYKILESFED